MDHRPFDYASATELLRDRQQAGLRFPFREDPSPLATPVELGGRVIENRLLAQPVEGFDAQPDGSPSEKNVSRYRQYAAGGSGAIWLESVSVTEAGRSNPSQLWIRPENAGRFQKLVQDIQEAGKPWGRPYTIIQLAHSGRYSGQHSDTFGPASAFHNPYIPRENETILTDGELEELEEAYVQAAVLSEQAGFDAVDIRACHGYIINELLAAREREGRYGGCFENRARFLLNVVDKVKARTGVEVAVRLNVFDAVPYPYGFGVSPNGMAPDMEEPLRLVKLLYEHGVRLLDITCGIGPYSPQVIRPSDRGGDAFKTEHPLEGVDRMLRLTRQVKQAVPGAVVAASAFTWLREYAANVAAGGIADGWFDLAGFGRQALCYPDYARDILRGGGLKREKCCVTCNGCMAWIKKTGKAIRCVVRDR